MKIKPELNYLGESVIKIRKIQKAELLVELKWKRDASNITALREKVKIDRTKLVLNAEN